MKEAATTRCLEQLLREAGLSPPAPTRCADGPRDWPQGYAGSLSKKGTVVVAALAPREAVASLGIDIETIDDSDLSGIPLLGPGENLPPKPANFHLGVLFSAKEAVFKAQYPLTGRRLAFDDVTIAWAPPRGHIVGQAVLEGLRVDVACSVTPTAWVLSIATSRPDQNLTRGV